MSKEKPLPPFNPYDPEQNQLLLIQPSWKNPILTLDRVRGFIEAVGSALDGAKEHIRLRTAMNLAEYFTSYYYDCSNPVSLSEPAFASQAREDFTIKVKPEFQASISQQPKGTYKVKI